MKRYEWSKLNHQQIGRYAEYFVKMEFTMFGFDVYSAEVDDKGIDFVVRREAEHYFDVQVKSVRRTDRGSYAFMTKAAFTLRPSMLLALVLFYEGEAPHHFLIPATAWLSPNPLLVGRDYEGKKSAPEWGVNISGRTVPMLEKYTFDTVVLDL